MKERILYKYISFIIVVVFCMTIFVPLATGIIVADAEVSQIEKRTLSKLPEMPETIESFQTFPQLFNTYYSDHFGWRDWFTKYYKLAKYIIGDSPSEDVTLGKDGWLFLGSIKNGYTKYQDPFGDFRNVNIYSQKELRIFARHMLGLKAWLNEKGIEYVFVIAPNKHTIYYNQVPNYITKINNRSAADQLIEYLKEHTNVSVVDLREKLIKAKEKHQLYYQTDTHWNHYAANLAQHEIMIEIESLFPNQIQPELIELRDATRGGGDLASFIGVNIFNEPDPQPVFKEACTPIKTPSHATGSEPYAMGCEGQNLNAIIYRDSFFTILQPYFTRKFKHSTYIWEKLSYSSLEKYVGLGKPDIVIEEWVERSLPHVPNEFNFINGLYKKFFENSSEKIFSKDETRPKFNAAFSLIDHSNGILRLRADGNDPIINFPLLPFTPNNEYVLHINISSSVESTLQVFYSDANQAGYPYSEENSLRIDIQKGNNDLYIALDYPNLGKHLRLDPITGLGEIAIKSLEIKRVTDLFKRTINTPGVSSEQHKNIHFMMARKV